MSLSLREQARFERLIKKFAQNNQDNDHLNVKQPQPNNDIQYWSSDCGTLLSNEQRELLSECTVKVPKHRWLRFKPQYETYLKDHGWQIDYGFDETYMNYLHERGYEVTPTYRSLKPTVLLNGLVVHIYPLERSR